MLHSPSDLYLQVNFIMVAVDSCVGAKLPCSELITTVCRFIEALQRLLADENDRYQSLKEPGIEQVILLSPFG